MSNPRPKGYIKIRRERTQLDINLNKNGKKWDKAINDIEARIRSKVKVVKL